MIAKGKDGKEKEFVETEPRHINHHESVLQQSCKRWFDLQYPQFSKLLFAVPNGGWRSKVEAVIMRREACRGRSGGHDIAHATGRLRFALYRVQDPCGAHHQTER